MESEPDEIPLESQSNFGLTKEVVEEVLAQKEAEPGMFVSAWQEDEEGVAEKDLSDPVEKWLSAAEEGRLEEVKSLVGASPHLLNSFDADGYTALHRAAYNNNIDVIEFLISSDANIEARTNEGWTPLLSASNWANFEAVAKLISQGADVNAASKGNLTALHLAVGSRSDSTEDIYRTVKYLLQAPGIDAGIIAGNGDTPLMMARRTSELCYNAIQEFMQRP